MQKKIIKHTLIYLILTFCILNFISCNSKNGNKNDQELVLAIGGEPESGFDPTNGWGRCGSPLFHSTLLSRDSNMNIINDIATSHKISEDMLTWTFEIRDDVKFSDGKELTAYDVLYTYQLASKSGSVVDVSIIKNMEVLSKYKIQFTLKEPQSTFVNTIISTGIIPKHYYNKDYFKQPIGSGPYKFVQWDRGQQLIIEINPYYYQKKPYFKKITFLYLSEDSAFLAAKTGKVDIVSIEPSYAKQKISNMKLNALESVDNRGIMFPYLNPGQKTKDGYEIGNKVTSDISIRKAIDIAVDRNVLINGVLNGYGKAAFSVCDQMPWWNNDTIIKDSDVLGAKKILADSGWKDTDGDGILEKGSIKAEFNLIYPSDDKLRQNIAILLAERIKQIGLKINIYGKSFDEIKKVMHKDAVLFGFGSLDPIEMYNLYSSKYRGIAFFNAGYYSNKTVDKYLNKALYSINEKEALQYWKKAQWDGNTGFSSRGDTPWVWLLNLKHLYFIREGLYIGKQKIHPHGHGWPITDNIVDWKWKK